MDLIAEYNKQYQFFHEIAGVAMQVHNKYRPELLESAYEAALKYLLELRGYRVERQVNFLIYWDDVQLDQAYRMDLVINGNIIVELKAISYVDSSHRKQFWNYMHLTHLPYGMLINFGAESLFSEWYHRDSITNNIEKVRYLK